MQVFANALDSRDSLFQFVKGIKFSSNQINRFIPSVRQIAAAHDTFTFDSAFLLTEIDKNLQYMINNDTSLQCETLHNLTFKHWADHDSQFPVNAAEEFLQILTGYFTAVKLRIRPQTHRNIVEHLLNTSINNNLFSVLLSEQTEPLTVPLAPLVMLLTIINTPHQLGAHTSRHWDLTQALQNTPLAHQTKTQQIFTVGLHHRLRIFS